MLNWDFFSKRVGNMKIKAVSLHCAITHGIVREFQEFSSHLRPRSLAGSCCRFWSIPGGWMPTGCGRKPCTKKTLPVGHLPKLWQKEPVLEDIPWSPFSTTGWDFLVSYRNKLGMDTVLWNPWLQIPPENPAKCTLELSTECTYLAPIQG